MPKGTRVHRCVEHMKRKSGSANPYAVCQASTGQSYATGRTMKKAKYNSKLMSPKGDFGKYQEGELRRAFPRPIKRAGVADFSSQWLPVKKDQPMAKDRGM